ncbi:uncharacterized protein [Rutidosis leptorrhynchoides]|uniref:uncharacterized protein isoform X2 n=1 Tax=Rutidosis leptorrhynchoides TaxID=125765 RepID=UPI003A9981E5
MDLKRYFYIVVSSNPHKNQAPQKSIDIANMKCETTLFIVIYTLHRSDCNITSFDLQAYNLLPKPATITANASWVCENSVPDGDGLPSSVDGPLWSSDLSFSLETEGVYLQW